MKRPFWKLCAPALVLLLCFLTLSGATLAASSGAFEYEVNYDGTTVTITGYTGPGGNVVVPATIGGKSVTVIGSSAFEDNADLTGITLPVGITTMDTGAFRNCTGLTSIHLPNTLKVIETAAFQGCTALQTVPFPAGVNYIGNYVFSRCTQLTNIQVDSANAVYSSVNGVLFDKNATELIILPPGKQGAYQIPAGVVKLAHNAFEDCDGLTSVSIPNGVESISYQCFNDCDGLNSIDLPTSVISIEELVFYSCDKLTSIEVSSANPNYSSQDGLLYNKTKTKLLYCPTGKPSLSSLPSTLTVIDDYAFTNCGRLTSVPLPTGVNEYGFSAFAGCSALKSIALPTGAKTLPYGLFEGCTALERIVLPSGVTAIRDSAFSNCERLTSISIPGTVSSIEYGAFLGCKSLKSVVVPAGLKELGECAFKGCTGLSAAYFYGGVPLCYEDPTDWFDDTKDDFRIYYHVSKSWSSYDEYPTSPFCDVTIDTRDGASVSKIHATITSGHIKSPTAPTRAGYAFTGWYKESSCETKWDFATAKITGNIKVYAGWKMGSHAVPQGIKAASGGYTKVKVTWSAVDGATKYKVYRATSKTGTYKKIAETTATRYTNTGLTTGKTYYYKIKAVAGSITSTYSAVVSAKPVPAAPTDVKAKAASSSSIKVTWAKVSGATKYQVYRATSKTGTYKKVAETTGLSATNKGLTDNKTYYYKVRAYHIEKGKKIYGSFSSVVRTHP